MWRPSAHRPLLGNHPPSNHATQYTRCSNGRWIPCIWGGCAPVIYLSSPVNPAWHGKAFRVIGGKNNVEAEPCEPNKTCILFPRMLASKSCNCIPHAFQTIRGETCELNLTNYYWPQLETIIMPSGKDPNGIIFGSIDFVGSTASYPK